jgi:hypothetical protein
MKDLLKDLLSHTAQLGGVDLIKIVGTQEETKIITKDSANSLMIYGKFKNAHSQFIGTFGMPNIQKLKNILEFEEYNDPTAITLMYKVDKGVPTSVPETFHFETKEKDFVNEYRLMSEDIINKSMNFDFAGTNYCIEWVPKIASIQRLKRQMTAYGDDLVFKAKLVGKEIRFYLGDEASHSANFVFETEFVGTMQHAYAFPLKFVVAVLDLVGDKKIYISDSGLMKITIDSGIADYEYLIPGSA